MIFALEVKSVIFSILKLKIQVLLFSLHPFRIHGRFEIWKRRKTNFSCKRLLWITWQRLIWDAWWLFEGIRSSSCEIFLQASLRYFLLPPVRLSRTKAIEMSCIYKVSTKLPLLLLCVFHSFLFLIADWRFNYGLVTTLNSWKSYQNFQQGGINITCVNFRNSSVWEMQ